MLDRVLPDPTRTVLPDTYLSNTYTDTYYHSRRVRSVNF